MIQNMPKTSITIPVGGMYHEWSCLMDLAEKDTAKPFEPEFAGKLNYYANAVDDLECQDILFPMCPQAWVTPYSLCSSCLC